LTNLLVKDVSFTFYDECINSRETLKKAYFYINHNCADWSKSFEIMCDASDFAIGTVLG